MMAHNSMETETTEFCGIGVEDAKNPFNIGGAVRACGCFDASFAVFAGTRWKEYKADWRNMDVMQRRKEMPVFLGVPDVMQYVPHDTTIVAIEKSAKSVSLPDFVHPRRAFYIFGSEDGATSEHVLKAAKHKVHVPAGSMNIAACVYVVLYDRIAKKKLWSNTQPNCEKCESVFNKVLPSGERQCITCGHTWAITENLT